MSKKRDLFPDCDREHPCHAEVKRLRATLERMDLDAVANTKARDLTERLLIKERDDLLRAFPEYGSTGNELREQRAAHASEIDELRAELETTANVIRVLSAEKEAAIEEAARLKRKADCLFILACTDGKGEFLPFGRRAAVDAGDLDACRAEAARSDAFIRGLQEKAPGPDQVVIPRADYEALVKALPATSPGLKVVPKEPDSPEE